MAEEIRSDGLEISRFDRIVLGPVIVSFAIFGILATIGYKPFRESAEWFLLAAVIVGPMCGVLSAKFFGLNRFEPSLSPPAA